MNWTLLHQHYTKVKSDYNLTSCDIIRQLGSYPYCSYIQYLSPEGIMRNPSTRQGTVGRKLRDLLTSGLNKTNWQASTASYKNKLKELNYDKCYINIHMINKIPTLDISLCMDVGLMMTKEELASMFTIDGVVPVIRDI